MVPRTTPGWRAWLATGLAGLSLTLAAASAPAAENESGPSATKAPQISGDADSTVDHSKFEELKGPFDNRSEVTEACLSCHTEAGEHVMDSIHWTWKYKNPDTGQVLGKRTLINNFCTNSRSNEGMCIQCHASTGWEEEDFDGAALDWKTKVDNGDPKHVDCLVCHDQTGTYYKMPPTEGSPACSRMFEGREPVDLPKVAQNVGMPGRENCGSCHFYGGGGDGVKHGDLDSSLTDPPRSLDVHMASDGLDFSCSRCHVSEQHQWAGSRYDLKAQDPHGTGKPGMPRHAATCESCHGNDPHPVDDVTGVKLNDHVDRVACQSCHIPEMARGGVATKVDWDWRDAGRLRDGEGYKVKDYTQGNGEHRATYKSIKGTFKYAENKEPTYRWYNGVMEYTTIQTEFDPEKAPIDINHFEGSPDDPNSRIWPFKRMHTIQPYDKGNDTLVYMHLWGDDDAAFWGNYDFSKAIRVGMKQNDIPYSGEYGFIDTYSWWPITHMVAPKEDAVSCAECHSSGGRLEKLSGFYLPGRRDQGWVDWIGLLLAGGALLGVLGHAFLRLFASMRRS